MEKRSLGEGECVGGATSKPVPHTPIPIFEPLDTRMVMRLRRKHGPDMIERLKEKIFALENNRKPVGNRKEIVAAYKARIRDVKNWMDGIQEPQTTK